MTNDELLLQAANASDQATKICKAAWDAGELPPALAAELQRHSEQLSCAAMELERRSRTAVSGAKGQVSGPDTPHLIPGT